MTAFKDILLTIWYIIRFPIQLVLMLIVYILVIIGCVFGVQITARTDSYHNNY